MLCLLYLKEQYFLVKLKVDPCTLVKLLCILKAIFSESCPDVCVMFKLCHAVFLCQCFLQ